MVVAAGAVHGHAEKRLADGGDDVVQFVEAGLGFVGGFIVPGAQAIEAGGDDGIGRGMLEFVAGDLLADELVEGFVGVEGLDDVIAVAPGVGLDAVALEGVGFCESDDVEPVAAPFFAVLRRGEEAVDDAFEGVGGIVG